MKLLRFLEEREFERVGGNRTFKVDVRIVAATHRDLLKKVQEGTFREDLYYRLNVVEIHVPPLRERAGDIPLLAHHFLQKYAAANGKDVRDFDDEVLTMLLRHPWPGNVRELENAMERAVVLSEEPVLHAGALPDPAPGGRARRGRRLAAAGRRSPSPAARSRRSSARPSCARWRRWGAARRAPRRSCRSARARSSTR